jgi:3-oxoacyl-[acyl-carrier protein] reductase
VGTDAVLISGSSGGIGSATAARFLAAGYEVLGVDLVEPDRVEPGVRFEAADVRAPGALVAALDRLAKRVKLRHVVSLAGRVLPEEIERPILELPAGVATFEASIQLNLTGQFNLVAAAMPRLERTKGDRSITLCSSVNALAGFGAPAYSAAKAGVIGMMHALAGELGPNGIRINTVAPGTTRTPLTEAEARADKDRKRFQRAAAQTHLRRVGEADDVAAAIESLSLRMTHVTDQVLEVDGGQLRAI